MKKPKLPPGRYICTVMNARKIRGKNGFNLTLRVDDPPDYKGTIFRKDIMLGETVNACLRKEDVSES